MKKITGIIAILLFAGLFATAQNPFIKDQDDIYLKVTTNKVGIGLMPGSEKLTVGSVAGEGPLALKGYSSPYSPYVALYSSDDVAIWKLFASPAWWTIGTTRDTTSALIVGKNSLAWLKINGTLAATRLHATTGTVTTLSSTTATMTTANTTTLSTNHFTASDSLGLYLYNAAGTRYRVFVTSSGTVSITPAP